MHIIYKLIDSFFFSISGNIFVECNKERTQQTTRIRREFRENVSVPTIESHSTMKFSFTLPEKTHMDISNMMQNIFIIIICVMLVIVLITNCKRR